MRRLSLLLALALPLPLAAQGRVTSAFVVTRQGGEMGQERLVVQTDAKGAPTTIKVELAALTGRTSEAVTTRASDGEFDALQLEFRDSVGAEIVRAGYRGNRIIVTSEGPKGRRTRELPADDHLVMLDEELHALLFVAAELATPSGHPLTGLYVRTGRRVNFTVTRRSMGSRGSAVDFKGGITAFLLLDAQGRLERLELPNEGIVLNPLPR